MRQVAAIILIAAIASSAQAADARKATTRKSSPPQIRVPSSGVLSRNDLMIIAAEALKYGHVDAFTDHPSLKYNARQFSIIQKFKADGTYSRDMDGTWSYDKMQKKLKFSIPYLGSRISVYFSSKEIGRHIGQNAYGVKVSVTEFHDLSVAVIPTIDKTTYQALEVVVEAEPEMARMLSREASVTFEGILTGRAGAVAECEMSTDEATITDPYETELTACSLAARLTRISVAAGGKAYEVYVAEGDAPVRASQSLLASVVAKPDWPRVPTSEDIARYYPDRAQRMEQPGRVSLSCDVNAQGRLENCSVISEYPKDYGFGDAAMKLARFYRMEPTGASGQPAAGRTATVSLDFVVPH